MSHVTAIRTVPIKDEEALRTAVEELGGKLERRNTYKWFGRSVGDYPLPKGIKVEDLGKCEMVAKFPGINYEVGFAKVEGEEGLFPLFDFWGSHGEHDGEKLQKVIGKDAGKLMQSYSVQASINAAMLQGYTFLGKTTDSQGNIHLELGVM